jgi:hypothetical protein
VLKSPCRKPKSQPEPPQVRRTQIVESRPQLFGPHDSQNVILVRAPVQTQWYGEHSVPMRRRNNFVIDFRTCEPWADTSARRICELYVIHLWAKGHCSDDADLSSLDL